MSLPKSLEGNRWTEITARNALPILIWCAKKGKTITYGQLDHEIVRRGLGHHVMAIQYGYPAGTIGNSLIELEEIWGDSIPPLNAIVVNAADGIPGKGVNYYLEHYFHPKKRVIKMTKKEKRAVVEEIHSDIFAYSYWDDVLNQFGMSRLKGKVELGENPDKVSSPKRGGWSGEGESDEHKALKDFIAKNPQKIGLSKSNKKGEIEYMFASADKADVVFETKNGFVGVEVKSCISNEADLNRGIFQSVKYQALLRAEQKALSKAPTATAILVTERKLSHILQNLADTLGIKVYVIPINI